jgi:hypothetical protein
MISLLSNFFQNLESKFTIDFFSYIGQNIDRKRNCGYPSLKSAGGNYIRDDYDSANF